MSETERPIAASEPQEARELTLTVRFRTYGTRRQARDTAERVANMLSVELHRPVPLVRCEYKVVEP